MNSSFSFASIVFKLCIKINHILNFCKMQFQSVNPEKLSPLNLDFYFEIAHFCESPGGVINRLPHNPDF